MHAARRPGLMIATEPSRSQHVFLPAPTTGHPSLISTAPPACPLTFCIPDGVVCIFLGGGFD